MRRREVLSLLGGALVSWPRLADAQYIDRLHEIGVLIPLAEKTKVVIALENVSNNLWVMPEIFRHFVQSFQSPWVKAYYDIGNHVRFAPPDLALRQVEDFAEDLL